MRLTSATLSRLRDDLRTRGARLSLPPPPGIAEATPHVSPDVLAVVERVAPICEVIYLLMMADRTDDAREQEVLRGTVRALTDGMLKTRVIDDMLARFESALKRFGRENRLLQVTAQLAADRADAEATFTLAAVMAIADESLDADERDLLEELRELLGISRARAAVLLGEAGLAED